MSGLIYLASPYSHPSPQVREERFLAACEATGKLMALGHAVVSPIAHSHAVARYGHLDEMDAALWQHQDALLLAAASEVWVLTLDGWKESKGVCHEVVEAVAAGKPVNFLTPDTLELDDAARWYAGHEWSEVLRASRGTEQPPAVLGEYPGLPPMDREDVTGLRRSGYLMERAQRERTANAAVLRIAASAPEGTPWMAAVELARRLDALTERAG